MKTSFIAFMSVISVILITNLACANPTKDYLKALSKEGPLSSEVKSYARSLGLNMSHISDSSINNTAKRTCDDLKVEEIDVIVGDTLLGFQQYIFRKKPTEQEEKKSFGCDSFEVTQYSYRKVFKRLLNILLGHIAFFLASIRYAQ